MATKTQKPKATGGAVKKQNDAETPKTESLPEPAAAIAVETVPAKDYPPRNIKYIGRVRTDRRTGKIIQNDAPITRTSGANVLELPDAAEQIEKRIFWHERAGEIVALFPTLYKLVVPGKKHPKRRNK